MSVALPVAAAVYLLAWLLLRAMRRRPERDDGGNLWTWQCEVAEGYPLPPVRDVQVIPAEGWPFDWERLEDDGWGYGE